MISEKQINDVKRECIQKAKEKCSKYRATMSLCGKAKSWDECFSYLKNKDGSLWMVFQYNVGEYTYAVQGTCYPEKKKG